MLYTIKSILLRSVECQSSSPSVGSLLQGGNIQYSAIAYFIILYFNILNYSLYYIVLYCIILYSTVFYWILLIPGVKRSVQHWRLRRTLPAGEGNYRYSVYSEKNWLTSFLSKRNSLFYNQQSRCSWGCSTITSVTYLLINIIKYIILIDSLSYP